PIIEHHIIKHHISKIQGGHGPIRAEDYINPLPHVLMLTAIVVAVATLGVALAMTIKIYKDYKTVEETEIISRIKAESLKEQTNQTVGRSFSGME
ncbi:MAG: cation:proton antiporter subunit C, partial [Desulfobacterales bacterium]|nr:cation:proton antiporter subunit C [Desulfobacterales bacterium]